MPGELECPPWCQRDVECDDLWEHTRTVARIGSISRPVFTVDVVAVDDIVAGTRCGPHILVEARDGLNATQAQQLSLGLLNACDVVNGST